MRFHVLNTSRSPHTAEKRATCPEAIGLLFRLSGQPIYHRTARWVAVSDLANDIERVCFGVRYGIIEVRYNSPVGDPLGEDALHDVVDRVQKLRNKVVKGVLPDLSGAFAHLESKPKALPKKAKAAKPKLKEVIKVEVEPEPVPEVPVVAPEVEELKAEEVPEEEAPVEPSTKKSSKKKSTSSKKKKRAASKKSD